MRSRPHRLHLNVTERCNLRCLHCYWEEYGRNPEPDLDTIDRILGEFKKLCRSYHEDGCHVLTLGGGEPTVRPDLEEVVALGVKRGFKVRLVTNGVFVDDERARALALSGVKAVQVSLDGAHKETHERVRGRGTWDRALRGIRSFKRAHTLVVLSYVLLPGINVDEAPAFLDLVRQLGVAGAKFARPLFEGQARANRLAVDGAYWDVFQRILGHAQLIRYRRLLLFFDPLAHNLPLDAARQTRGVWGLATDLCQCNNTELVEINGGTGDVYYCRVRTVLGNIWRENLTDLWHNHPLLTGIRRKVPVGACSGCQAWAGCRGGCPAVVHSVTGDPMVQDQDCHRVKRQQLPLLHFPATGCSNARSYTTSEALRLAGRRLRDLVYWAALR